MINANELRLGNLVYYRGDVVKIHGLNYHGDISLNLYADKYKLEEIEPIPITSEWLNRCGFNKLNAGWINSSGSICFYDRTRDINGYYSMDYGTRNYVARFKYLHQLQNLYFVLTGEELKLKDQ